MFGALTNAGYPAYTVTFVGIPPLALWAIQWGNALFGTSLAVRYPMMLFSLVGIGGIFWSLQPWKSWLNLLAGLLAALFLSFNTFYFYHSASIMAEVPAVAMSILALALAQQYQADRKLFWLALSGAAFALSLALKVFVIFLPALIGVLILLAGSDHQNRTAPAIIRQLAIAGGVWLGGFLLPLAIFVIIYDPWAMVQQVFTFRLELRTVWAQRITLLDNLATVGQMWLSLGPWVGVALLGAITGWWQRRLEVRLWLTWWALATLLLVWHIPLRDRYIVLLAPPLAALSGIAVANSVEWLFYRLKRNGARRLSAAIIILLLAGVIGWTLVIPVKSATLPPSPDTFPDLNLEAIQYIWKNSLADDCLITDDQRFAFAANRLVPAALSETSWARIATGGVTVEEIANQVTLHDCPMIVYADWRFDHHLPNLRTRLRELYFLELTFGKDVIIYTANKQITKKPAVPFEAQLGQAIGLKGIDFTPPAPWHTGQEVRLATYWTATEPPQQAYKIFLQLRNSQHETVVSADHFPFPAPSGNYRLVPNLGKDQVYSPEEMTFYPAKGMWPTNAWPVGQTIREITPLTLPADLPAGVYHLYLGMYEPDTQARLPVQHESGESDALPLATIEILN
jgi:hypothetical protein